MFTILICLLENAQASSFLTFHNGFVDILSAASWHTAPSHYPVAFCPFICSLCPILSICSAISSFIFFSLSLSIHFRVHKHHAGTERAGVFLNPNRQIDLGCLLNPFVFGLALMKELLGCEHIRLCICVGLRVWERWWVTFPPATKGQSLKENISPFYCMTVFSGPSGAISVMYMDSLRHLLTHDSSPQMGEGCEERSGLFVDLL